MGKKSYEQRIRELATALEVAGSSLPAALRGWPVPAIEDRHLRTLDELREKRRAYRHSGKEYR